MSMVQIKNFTENEKNQIFKMVASIAGTHKVANEKPDIFLNNIQRRMYANNIYVLSDYIKFAQSNEAEFSYLVSSLTIHTTYWFREPKHFESLEHELSKMGPGRNFIRVLSMGCSTGEEAYTIGLIMEFYRVRFPLFDYFIDGFDIDPISIKRAQKAIYSGHSLNRIPKKYHPLVMLGSGKTEGLMTLSPEIRKRCKFHVASALDFSKTTRNIYQIIFCRNMLIYFSDSEIDKVVEALESKSDANALFYIGHSEDIGHFLHGLSRVSGSLYKKISNPKRAGRANRKSIGKLQKDVLIVDDSKTIRATIAQIVNEESLTCFTSSTASEASDALKSFDFKLIVLDLNLPDERGEQWLMRQRQQGCLTPCIIITGVGKQERNEVLGVLGKAAQDLFMKSALSDERGRLKERIDCFVHSHELFSYAPKSPVVFIDDNSDMIELYEDIIKSRGLDVQSFTDPLKALEFLKLNPAHCIFLDHHMPRMSGEKFYWEYRKFSRGEPLILLSGDQYVSSLAYAKQAFRVLKKPIDNEQLVNATNDATHAKYMGELGKFEQKKLHKPDLILIGASTGGPQALNQILHNLGDSLPPVIVVQHIQKDFQESFGQSLAVNTGLDLEVVSSKQMLKEKTIYIAAADKHITVGMHSQKIFVTVNDKPSFKGHRPCVDHLFKSAAKMPCDLSIMAILLTGMGDDGAEGLFELKKNGAYTVAQSFKSATVFGMPRVAIDLGAAVCIADLRQINQMLQIVSRS